MSYRGGLGESAFERKGIITDPATIATKELIASLVPTPMTPDAPALTPEQEAIRRLGAPAGSPFRTSLKTLRLEDPATAALWDELYGSEWEGAYERAEATSAARLAAPATSVPAPPPPPAPSSGSYTTGIVSTVNGDGSTAVPGASPAAGLELGGVKLEHLIYAGMGLALLMAMKAR